ncbi:choline transport protein [Marchantia polymorpha subsp. ruderalis]|uniref:Uncharacterized protein n=2 Tax=Marchantia polymorpha TaxID=3197 RepID=A0A176VNQ0_MARPO|nr:hypothetical protein AXG93_2423s1270 [Marchantia polymorpha subsp. ruderalis]PTQ28863.1 hypothetical protein MARPO_0153s0028 [Marchantia polymorpha]BBM98586.1 hypothetical protein Mp_1g14610 [Marchantia polymorpha subsp. ruderalis]|eukprot:PTQ28863.1 hypothetical protein MARPO_0153s0028 [Marchantia polymorpha]
MIPETHREKPLRIIGSESELLMAPKPGVKDTGQARLEALGYKQELKRDLSLLSNFAFSFSIISILTGVTTLYNTGLTYGGTVSMVYGWLITGFFNMFVGLSMAEICSAFPTSGGLYYWSYMLAGPSWGPFASWITGWYNVIGQWAVTTSVDFSLATLLQVIILLATGGGNGGGYYASKYVVISFHCGILLTHALLNSLPIVYMAYLGTLSAVWNLFGVFVLMILIPLVATERQSATFVFTSFFKDASVGITSEPYIFLLGLLMSQYSISGYDASAHMSEETKSSDKNGGYGILAAIGISVIVGWAYIVGITFAVVDPVRLLDKGNDAKGYAIAQVFYDVFNNRYGDGTGGILCLGVVAVAVFFCGMSCVTSNSRMVYAFSRDGAMPGSNLWHVVDKREVPRNAVWLSATIAFLMALTSLGSVVAFQAMVSIATIGLYISYALPILFRITVARNTFVPGPINFGRYSLFLGWVSVLWVITVTVLFCLPTVYPVKANTLNYTPIAVGGVMVFALGYWLLSARKWFKGPISNFESKPLQA